ncbi:MAG: hypothetical protein RR554_09100 [Vagococcus sp.]|uniref:hypothetical protein n=1 Tax=Vagococcus sp. TaxID=1933889 RepID=UPI002FCB96AE
MKLRQTLLGIALSFSTIGVIATSVDNQAYQEIYDQQKQQEVKVKQALDSEFISTKDEETLENMLVSFDKAKNKDNRESLNGIISQEKKVLDKVETNLVSEESNVAKEEHATLSGDVKKLIKKLDEPFILKADKQEAKELETQLTKVKEAKKVKPVREVADAAKTLSLKIHGNQKEAKELSLALKTINEESAKLSEKKYVFESDKKSLEKDRKENTQFFKDADDLAVIKKRKSDSDSLLSSVSDKRDKTETDFKDNEEKSRDLATSIEKLVADGKLTTEEKTGLTNHLNQLNDSLALKEYQPGDLKTNYDGQKSDYDSFLKNSNKKIAEEKAQAEKEAKEQAQKAQEEARRAAENSQKESSVSSDGWHQAPAGYKYLKVTSGLTYGQVKIPGNFSLISEAEASNYRPGHGNGSAKQ